MKAASCPAGQCGCTTAIYQAHPTANCIITAQSPNVTAYAISEERFDTRTIPESYVLLRDIPVIPYGTQFREPDRVAAAFAGHPGAA